MRLACAFLVSTLALGLTGCGGGGTTPEDMAKAVVNGDMASNMATLKLEDYLSWCSVTVNSGTAATTAVQSLTFPKGTVVHLSADKASATFVFGYWIGTAGDTGAAHDTSMTTTVTLNADTTVQACCPFANAATTPCGAPN